MQTKTVSQSHFLFLVKYKGFITDLVVYAFIILFMYTAASKLFTIDSFASTLSKSPLIGRYGLAMAWTIPTLEIAISFLLVLDLSRKWSIPVATGLMLIFTAYLSYMVLSGSKLPCHCGGLISTLTWSQHIWFNIGFITLGFLGLWANKK